MTPAQWPTYTEYTPSDISWCPEIPSHWGISPARSLFDESRVRNGKSDGYYLSLMAGMGIIPYEEKGDVGNRKSDDLSNCKVVDAGDFVINSMNFGIGSFGRSAYDGVCSSVYVILKSKRPGLSNYLERVFQHPNFQAFSQSLGNGILAHRCAIGWDELKSAPFPVPPEPEAVAIASFLDEKCAKVDEAVRIKEEQIALLRERRQILIQEAVTRGLNPDAPMKDSGIDWIGRIPSHWAIKKLKNLCRFSGGSTPSKERKDYWENGTVPWVSPKDMKQSYVADTQDRMTEKAVRESAVSFVCPGSLLIVARSGILQRTIPVAINSAPVTLNQDMKALTFGTALMANYMMFLIEGNSSALLPVLTKEGATVESIEQGHLANCYVPVPPPIEQRAIVADIENSNRKLDGAIKIKEKQITALKEYKTILINAAVTGKIKVA